MGKGGYLGGSTIIRAFPKLSGRQPKKGAIESWVKDARENEIALPDDMQAALRATKTEDENGSKKRGNTGRRSSKKRVRASGSKAKKRSKAQKKKVAKPMPNEPLPEFSDLVNALREKYSK
jgi:hypothetical protein